MRCTQLNTDKFINRAQQVHKNKIILAKSKSIPLIEFNYKQFKYLSKEQFEDLVISEIQRKVVINA